MVIAGSLEQSQRSRSDVELCYLVLHADIPVSAEIRVCWSTLEHYCGNAKHQRRVDDVCVSGDPAHVATTEEDIGVVDVEDILPSRRCAEQVTCSRVHDTFGLASRPRRVQQEQRILGVHADRWEVCWPLLHLFVPPVVSTLGERHLCARTLVDQTVRDIRALFERIVDNLLRADGLTTTLALVGGDHYLGLGIDYPISQRVGTETSEHDRVHSTDTGAGEESEDSFRYHGKIQSYRVSLLDTHLCQDPGKSGDLAKQLTICDGATIALLVCLEKYSRLIWIPCGVSVHAIVRGVKPALEEPCVVAVLERADVHGLEVTFPSQ